MVVMRRDSVTCSTMDQMDIGVAGVCCELVVMLGVLFESSSSSHQWWPQLGLGFRALTLEKHNNVDTP